MSKPPSSIGLSHRVASAQAEILRIATSIVPDATVISWAFREMLSCTIAVETDAEKERINDNAMLLAEMVSAAGSVGRKPDYLRAESQETVDRLWKGHWLDIWR